MFISKEEAKLLSDDEFERIGRRKKTIVSIIIIMIVLIAAILAFRFIKKDENINIAIFYNIFFGFYYLLFSNCNF